MPSASGSPSVPAEWRAAAVDIARAAGAAILEVYGQNDVAVQQKADRSPLTAADLAAHRLITTRLRALTPELPVLSEEAAEQVAPEVRRSWRRYWLVDPLDGTKEFINRNGEFTVNIALIDAGRPCLGVVYVPVQDVCYSAAGGSQNSAFCRRGEQPEQPIRVQTPAPAVLRMVGSRSHASPAQHAFAERLGEHRLLSVGSSLKFCLVAEGSADVYPRFGPTSEWDTAAAQCVVEQAGGRVVTVDDFTPLRYNAKDSLLNPHFLVFGDAGQDWRGRLKNLA